MILEALRNSDRPLTSSELAGQLDLESSLLSTVLSELYKYRLVTRDRRQYGVSNFQYRYWVPLDELDLTRVLGHPHVAEYDPAPGDHASGTA